MGAKRRKGRLLPHFLLFAAVFGLQIQPTITQFGEIASVITGLLGSGGGLAGSGAASGLSGLAGSGAGLSGLSGLAGAGASAGSGAASALGGVGQLYQLAQAALQLTGTGVGIANQASESAWFPVAVENAAKMNRDFQDRLLRGGTGISAGAGLPGLPRLGGLGGAGGTTTKLGTEYGKNFESGEGVEYGETEKPETLPPPASSTSAPLPVPPASFGQKRPLPGLVSLLPGESSGHVEEVDVPRPSITISGPETKETSAVISESKEQEASHHNRGVAALISSRPSTNPNARSDLDSANAKPFSHANRDLMQSSELEGRILMLEKAESKPNIEFSTDSENEEENEARIPLLYPLKASAPTAKSVSSIMTELENIEESELPYMVPELKKLIKALKASNLSREDFNEISDQLASNKDVDQPRENTSPLPTAPTEAPFKEENESKGMKIPHEKRDKATSRNLAALRSALSNQIMKKVQGDHPAPVVISLQRPHPRQVERSASRLHRLNSYPARLVHGESGEQIESSTAKAKVFAVTAHARRVLPERSHRQVGQTAGQADVPVQLNTGLSSEGSRTQIDDATGRQMESKNTAPTANTTPSPQSPVVTQAQFHAQQWQQTIYPANNYQPNNYYNYQQQQQQVYYPQYGAYYYPQQLQQQQQQYSSGQQQQQQYYYQTTPRTQPARMVPEPVPTTPSSLLHHPFGHGALLTLMQPTQIFGKK